MPPLLALLLTFIFIVFLFRMDFKRRPQVSRALWVPTIWLAIIASRPISLWLGGGIMLDSPDATLEGSPVDASIYFILMLAALIILAKRKVSLSQFIAKNGWICFYLFYGLISVTWSDFPLAAFKRWTKSAAGNIMMCLIILSDHDPGEALKTVIRRCAYVLLPISIMLIKYFPDLGRRFDTYTGIGLNTGITLGKNALGFLCLVTGFILIWSFISLWRQRTTLGTNKRELYMHGILLWMISYLLIKAHSATSLGSLFIGVCAMMALGLLAVKRNIKHLGSYVFLGLLFLSPLMLIAPDYLVSTSVEVTGHESTFLGRVELWKALIDLKTDPLIGTGFESFWNSKIVEKLWEVRWWKPTEAHNGYIETYVNLGGTGVFLLLMLLLSSFNKIQRALLSDTSFEFGRLRLGFLIIAIICNVTEAAFKGLSPVWFMLLLVTIELPRPAVYSIMDRSWGVPTYANAAYEAGGRRHD